jgi:Tfp pilus assembly protein PilF
VRIELAITLHQAGDDAEATDHLNQALEIANRLDLQPQKSKAEETLATIRGEATLKE